MAALAIYCPETILTSTTKLSVIILLPTENCEVVIGDVTRTLNFWETMDTLHNIFVSKPFKCRFNGTPYYPRLGWGCSSGDICLRLNVYSKYD